ncbi:hypothetical protein I3843_05G107200 [Carya illinoinensis]|nr:hypothetical protein I3843_05G107200 [Carya illinoinensis]
MHFNFCFISSSFLMDRSAMIHLENSTTLPIFSTTHVISLFFILIPIMFSLCKLFYKLIRSSIIWDFVIFLYDSFSKGSYEHDHDDILADSSNSSTTDPEPAIGVYEWKPAAGGRSSREVEEECTVCLSKIEEGEEMRELRCEHHFHRICLDRWIGYKGVTCPLCRDSLFLRKTVCSIAELGVELELLHFKYCCLSSSGHRRETWWLR